MRRLILLAAAVLLVLVAGCGTAAAPAPHNTPAAGADPLLLGNKLELVSGTLDTTTQETIEGTGYEVLHTGEVESLEVFTSKAVAGTATKIWLGLYTVEAAKKGTLIASGEYSGTAPGTGVWVKVTVSKHKVTSGEKLVICELPVNGTFKFTLEKTTGNTGKSYEFTTKTTTLPSPTITWSKEAEEGPVGANGFGTEGGGGGGTARLVMLP